MRAKPNKDRDAETPNGIRRKDWARVHQCAVAIANAVLADDEPFGYSATRASSRRSVTST
jgi:hypothetical protein